MLNWWARLSKGARIAIVAAVIVGAPVFIAGMVSGAKDSLGSKPAGKSSPSSPPALTASPEPTRELLPSPDATRLAPASTRRMAAGILHANDAYYKREFDRGVTVILARGHAGSYPAFSAWYRKASVDVQPGTTALKQADALFTADNEPPSVGTWRDDNGTVQGDLFTLAQDGLGVGGPDDTSARQKVQDDIKQFHTDSVVAEHDADQVAAGK